MTGSAKDLRLGAINALLAASVLLPLLIFGAIALRDRAESLASTERDLLSTLDTLQGHAENLFRFQSFALGVMEERLRGMSDEDLRDQAGAHHAHLAELRRQIAGTFGIVVFGADGRPLLESDRPRALREIDVSDREYFRQHRDDPAAEPRISGPIRSRADGTSIFFVTRRRSAPDGSFAGILAAGARQETLTSYWDRAAPAPQALVALIREDGTLLARRPGLVPSDRSPPVASVAVSNAIRTGKQREPFASTSPLDGVERVLAIRRLEGFPVYVAHGVPRAATLAGWRRRLLAYGAFAVAAATALFFLALLARRRTRELHALNAELERRFVERTAELRAGEDRLRLLAREVDHRAKNALAVVQATLRLTPKRDTESYAKAVEGRVSALARAQTLLAQDRWRGVNLEGLLRAELAPFAELGEAAARARFDGPSLLVPPAAAQPLALAVHELVTNAARHGALSRPGGQVLVTWRLDADAGGRGEHLMLRWVEAGGPPVDGPPVRSGFGSRVVDGVVRGQLGGTLTLSWRPSGLVCEISIPLARLAKAAPEMEERGAV